MACTTSCSTFFFFFFFQAEDGIRDKLVTGVQTCALPIGAFIAGALVIWALARLARPTWLGPLGFAALLFDTAVIGAYGFVYSYEYGNQTRWALVLVVVEAALRYALAGAVATALALVPYYWVN